MPASARYTVSHHEKQGSNDGLGPGDAGIRSYRQSLLHGSAWPPASFRVQPTPALIRAARARATTAAEAYANKPVADTAVTVSPEATVSTRVPRAQQMHARALAAQAAHQQRMANDAMPAAANTPGHACKRSAAFRGEPDVAFGQGFLGFGGVPFGKQGLKDGTAVFGQGAAAAGKIMYPSLNLEEKCRDIIDELQVDLSLPLVDDIPSPSVDMGYTSPSAAVDISAFLPAPGPPALIANETTIAASAVPLADWAAEVCWRIIFGSPSATKSLVAKGVGRPSVNNEPLALSSGFAGFKDFVNTTLSATLPSPQCLFLGLFYLSKLPIGYPDLLHDFIAPLSPPISTTDQMSFHRLIVGIAGGAQGGAEFIAQVLFTVGLSLGNKWLEDNTFTTRTWHEVTSIPQERLRTVETAALKVLIFSLSVTGEEWFEWILKLRSLSSILVAREPVGAVGSATSLAIRRLDELIRLASSQGGQISGGIDEDSDIVLLRSPRDTHRSFNTVSANRSLAYPEWTNPMFSPEQSLAPPYERPLYVLHDPAAYYGSNDNRPEYSPHLPAWTPGRSDMGSGHWVGSLRRWDRVEAEMAAQEMEQAALVRGWPRPTVLGPSWARQAGPMALST